jgi:hypothetical protein
MKKIYYFLVLPLLLLCSNLFSQTNKVFIKSIENKIEFGSLANNRNLSFGFKNILLENLQELDFDITDSENNADIILKVDILFFDVKQTEEGFSVFHKSDNQTILVIKGYLYNKDGKKIKESSATGKSSEISLSTLIISESGDINQTSVSNVIKKSSETLIQNLFKKK